MSRVRFETAGPTEPSDPNRADIGCFVGFVHRRRTPVPADVLRWLEAQGWLYGPYGQGTWRIQALRDVPVPVDSWEVFDHLFAWNARVLDRDGATGDSYLGAAVRSFFLHGGRKCYVVRLGNPWRYDVTRAWRYSRIDRMVPGFPDEPATSPADRSTWSGIGHLFGLRDVSFLCLPDLPDAVRTEPVRAAVIPPPPPPPEQFVECADETGAGAPDETVPPLRAPRADRRGLQQWATALRRTAQVVTRHAREVQIVASIPLLPEDQVFRAGARSVAARDDLLRYLVREGWLSGRLGGSRDSIASAFVQLAYPWLRSPGSRRLPEGLEPPDGTLLGMLAGNALLRGTYRSAAGRGAGDVYDVFPPVGRDQMERPVEDPARDGGPPRPLMDRVSLFGPTPGGVRLLSDVTTAADESYRPAAINRLVGVLIGAARRAGEEVVFESSGPDTWRRLEENLGDLLRSLLSAGALRGATEEEAFQVRCDRSTMTQNDIDNGRLIARVLFQPSAPIERIVVSLILDESGEVSLGSGEGTLEAA